MKTLLLLVVMGLAMPQKGDEQFSVEKLTQGEVDYLKDADKEFQAAQSKHSAAYSQVEQSHGQSLPHIGPNGMFQNLCGEGFSVSVEIRGEYALITKTKKGSCVSW